MLEIQKTFSNRFERKYVIDIETYKGILKSLKPFIKRDKHAGKCGKYKNLSVYYDSDNYRFFTEKINGEKKRAKLRLRVYEPFGRKENSDMDKTIFLEIKKRNDQTVFKERIALPFSFARGFIEKPVFTKELLDKLSEKDMKALTEAIMLKELYHIKPKILIHYIREAFVCKYGMNLRITFDSCLRYRTNDLRLVTKLTDRYFLPPNLMVMELKYNTQLPIWIIDIFQKHSCILRTYSKYCNGLIAQFERDKDIIY